MAIINGVTNVGCGIYRAYINVNNKRFHLLNSHSIGACVKVRKMAEEAKASNTFDEFYKELVRQRNRAYNR